MLLNVPPIMQSTPHSCGDTSIACVLGFHRIVAKLKASSPINGLSPEGMEGQFRKIGLSVVAGEMSVDDLAYFCNSSRPPIALVTFDGDSHWVVVRGVSRGRVYYHDPLEGSQNATADEWAAVWYADSRLTERYQRWGVVAWPG